MNGDEMISEINRNTRPNRERRIDTTHELRILRTQVKYMFFFIIFMCMITISLLFYTMKHIEGVCAVNMVRYSKILQEIDDLKLEIEFLHAKPKKGE